MRNLYFDVATVWAPKLLMRMRMFASEALLCGQGGGCGGVQYKKKNEVMKYMLEGHF